jgi:hypothetical protein
MKTVADICRKYREEKKIQSELQGVLACTKISYFVEG